MARTRPKLKPVVGSLPALARTNPALNRRNPVINKSQVYFHSSGDLVQAVALKAKHFTIIINLSSKPCPNNVGIDYINCAPHFRSIMSQILKKVEHS